MMRARKKVHIHDWMAMYHSSSRSSTLATFSSLQQGAVAAAVVREGKPCYHVDKFTSALRTCFRPFLFRSGLLRTTNGRF